MFRTLALVACTLLFASCSAAPTPEPQQDMSVFGQLRRTEETKAFALQVEKFPDLRERLGAKTGSGVTVFAPSNEALMALSVVDNAGLRKVLERHVVETLLDEGDLMAVGGDRVLSTAGSGQLMLGATENSYVLNGTPIRLLQPTISGDNGNAFVIDRVIPAAY